MNKVFKYRDLKSAETTKLLKDFELFFNEPKNFNDPFDSFIEFDFNGTLQEWENYFKSLAVPPDIIKKTINDLKRGVKKPENQPAVGIWKEKNIMSGMAT